MNYKEFKKKLAGKDIGGAYLFSGEEGLIIERTIEYIVNSFLEPTFRDLNLTYLHGSNINSKDFYGYIETLPFMSKKRIVIIDELSEMLQKIDTSDDFLNTIKNLAKETILIFNDLDQRLNKTTKFYKFLKKINANVEFAKLDNVELLKFIKREVESKGKKIKDSDISYFIMNTGYQNKKLETNLYELISELKKLISYSSGEEISKGDIDKIIKKTADSNIFNLLEALAKKDSIKALEYFHGLYEKNESIAGILHMIQRRYRHLYEYRSLYSINKSDSYIRQVLSISDFEYKTIGKMSANFNTCQLKNCLNKILEIDKRLKSTTTDELILMEYMIVSLCN